MKKAAKSTLILALAVPLLAGSWCQDDPPAGGYVPTTVPHPHTQLEGAPEAEAPELEVVGLDATTTALVGRRDAHDVDVGTSTEDAGLADVAPVDAGDPPRVFWVSPTDGAHLVSASTFEAGTEHFALIPAHLPSAANEGHLHILVDLPCATPGDVFPAGLSEVVDLNEGQSTARLLLPVGPHTLCLQAGTSGHVALPLTDVLTVLVQ